MKRFVYPAMAILLGMSAALLAAEWALKTFDLGPLSRAPAPMSVDRELIFHRHDPDPVIGYTMRPGKVGEFQGLPTRINQHGCRGPEPKGDGPLVVALGDSITFGAGVHEAKGFPALVAGELERRGTPVRMLGCGVSGYNLEQMMARYERDLSPNRPALVLLSLFADDLSPAYILEDRTVTSWLRFHSAIFRAVERSKLWPGSGNRPVPAWAKSHADYAAGIQQRLIAFIRKHRAAGTSFLAITHPLLGDPIPGPGGPNEQLARLAATEGVPVVRMRPVYEEATDGDMLKLSILPASKDPHPTARGHTLIARKIVEAIESEDLLNPERMPAAVSSAELIPPPAPTPPPVVSLKSVDSGVKLPSRICAVLGDGPDAAGVRYQLERSPPKAEWVIVEHEDPLLGAMACVEQGAGGLMVAVDPMATERTLRGPAFDPLAVAVPLPGPPPRGTWGPNSIGGGAPIEDVGAAVAAEAEGLRTIALLHIGGPMGESIAAELRTRAGIEVAVVALDKDDVPSWTAAANAATADGLVVVGPPAAATAVAKTLKAKTRSRIWFSEWATNPGVLDAVVAADALDQARWINRLPPAGPFWQPARQRAGNVDANLFSAGAAAALLLDRGVAGGGSLSDILERASSGEGPTPYGDGETTTTGGVLHLQGARYGVIRGVEGVDGGWAFSRSEAAGDD